MNPVIGCGLFCYDPIICLSLTVPIPITAPQTADALLLADSKPLSSSVDPPATTKASPVHNDIPGTTTEAGPVIQLNPLDTKPVSIKVE